MMKRQPEQKEARVDVKKQPVDFKLEHPRTGCPHTQVFYTGRDGPVRVILSEDAIATINADNLEGNGQWKKNKGIGVGDPPDIIVAHGWVYIVGKGVSAGTGSHAICSTGSKMIVDTTPLEDSSVKVTEPRLLHVHEDSGAPIPPPANSWTVTGRTNYLIGDSFRRQGTTTGMKGAETIAVPDSVVVEADKATERCNWDVAYQPYKVNPYTN